jgi:hypothetical protein
MHPFALTHLNPDGSPGRLSWPVHAAGRDSDCLGYRGAGPVRRVLCLGWTLNDRGEQVPAHPIVTGAGLATGGYPSFAIVESTNHDLHGAFFEARCIPGGLIGIGRTPEQAMESLSGLLGWTRDEEPDFVAWHRDAWTYATEEDRAAYAAAGEDLLFVSPRAA